ncbi:MAG: protein BatD [Bacteroidetes bacterium]|nr:protein BatD [Bacteroidota bacterium]
MLYVLNRFFLLTVSVVLAFAASAQAVYTQVSSKKVQVGVPFECALVITVGATSYSSPGFKDFEVVSGPFESRMTQNINGVVSSQITLSWGLVARKEGKFTITPALVNAGNQKYETAPVVIEVTKGASQQSGTELNKGVSVDDGELFIKTVPSRTKLYVGEQLTITHKLFSRLSLVGMKKYDAPVFDGFWTKKLDVPNAAVQENIDGVAYLTAEIEKHLLYASAPGKKTIPAIQPVYVVRKTSNKKPRSLWEQFMNGQQYEDVESKAKSNPVTIEILPLPDEGKPASFNGAVGKLNFRVEANSQTVKANEAINLKITISGTGNFPLMDAPKLNFPESFESYDPKIAESTSAKSFDYLIIPRSEGQFILKDLEFSYFNTETKKYSTIQSPQIKINVLPGGPNSAGAQVFTPQNQVKETENDIRYIKKGNFELAKSETEFFNSVTHIALIILPILGLIATLIFRRNYIKNNSNLTLVKERKAAKVARKQLVRAEQLMQQNKKDEFYTEILMGLNNYLSHKLNIPISDLSRNHIQNTLVQKQIDASYISKLLATIETSEYAKYAPGAVSGDLNTVYTDTVSLVTELEKQLNKKI